MNIIGKVTVLPRLPQALRRLEELAYNLYWSWTPRAQDLFRELDARAWENIAGFAAVVSLDRARRARLGD